MVVRKMSKASPSILLVDDTPDTLQVLTQFLKEEGYEVRPVLNGFQALAAANNNPPDLILLDIVMPDMDGYEVCTKMKENPATRHIPIIFLTAKSHDENVERGLVLGAVDYITKPYNPDVVKARVATHVELKLQRDMLLMQAEDMKRSYEELEAFSYSVSHDLKSPLQVIRTFSSCLLECLEAYGYDDCVDDVRTIQLACEQMDQIITDLLQLSKANMESLSIETIEMDSIAKVIVSDLRRKNPDRNVEFICEDNMTANADSNLMHIALFNLIQNAWKYSSKQENAIIEFGTEEINCKKTFYVRDNGVGFDIRNAKELFTAFKRFHRAEDYEGTGIGLAIVMRIVKRHGGSIWAQSEVGKGSKFTFTLN